MSKRRSLTPAPTSGAPSSSAPNALAPLSHAHSQAPPKSRRGGVRQTVSDRVTFRSLAGVVREGWALNVSRGGIRAILDEDTAENGAKVELGDEYLIFIGDQDGSPRLADQDGSPRLAGQREVSGAGRKGRIVWLQEEPDGFVVGVEYASPSGTHRAVASSAPPAAPPTTEGGAAVDASGVSPTAAAYQADEDLSPDKD